MRFKEGRLSNNAGQEINPPDAYLIIRSSDNQESTRRHT